MVSINGVWSIKERTHASVYFKCTLSLVQRVLAVLSLLIYKWLLEPIHLERKCWNCLRKLFNTASGDEFTTPPLYSASLPCSGWTYSTHSWRFTPPFTWLTQFVSLPHLSDLYSTRLSLNLVLNSCALLSYSAGCDTKLRLARAHSCCLRPKDFGSHTACPACLCVGVALRAMLLWFASACA